MPKYQVTVQKAIMMIFRYTKVFTVANEDEARKQAEDESFGEDGWTSDDGFSTEVCIDWEPENGDEMFVEAIEEPTPTQG
jgi:hypothetical protein